MPGVPDAVADGPWWWLFLFLICVVFVRAQGTYWLGRWLRRGLAGASDAEPAPEWPVSRRDRLAKRFSGAGWEKAQAFVDRWGFVGIPISFLTVGFQTMVNAAAGFARMRWDLYTVAMIPGCLMWAALYTALGLGLADAWGRSPWLFLGVLTVLVGAAWAFTVVRRRSREPRATA